MLLWVKQCSKYIGEQHNKREGDEENDTYTVTDSCQNLVSSPCSWGWAPSGCGWQGVGQSRVKDPCSAAAAAGRNSDNAQEKQTQRALDNHWFLFLQQFPKEVR